eukprot:1157342-Pelagomonas_calceolata.AAC.2
MGPTASASGKHRIFPLCTVLCFQHNVSSLKKGCPCSPVKPQLGRSSHRETQDLGRGWGNYGWLWREQGWVLAGVTK